MKTIIYLKAPSKADVITELASVGGVDLTYTDENAETQLKGSGLGFALDYVGKIRTAAPVIEDDVIITPAEYTTDVHVNIRVEAPLTGNHTGLEEQIINAIENASFTNVEIIDPAPVTPARTFS